MSLLEEQFSEMEKDLRIIFRGTLIETKPIARTTNEIKSPKHNKFTDLTFMGKAEDINFGIKNIRGYSIKKLGLEGNDFNTDSINVSYILDTVSLN
jgi:hypothetical protein